MIYFDTSALVPMFFKEATSTAIESLIRGLPHHIATLDDWTRVEFSSFLAKEVRMGGLSSTEAQAIDRRFEAEIRASFTTLGVTAADFDLAKVRLADHRSGLRSGDALHLAIATNNRVQGFCSFDKVLMRNAQALGLSTDVGLPLSAS